MKTWAEINSFRHMCKRFDRMKQLKYENSRFCAGVAVGAFFKLTMFHNLFYE